MPVSIDYSPRTKGNILVENKKVIDIYEVSYGEDGMILVGKEYKIVFKLSAKYLKVWKNKRAPCLSGHLIKWKTGGGLFRKAYVYNRFIFSKIVINY